MQMQDLEPWVIEELSQAEFGDHRLTKRFMRLVSDLAARPEATVPQACADAAATKGAYRFWDHEQVTPEAIRAAHRSKTVERVQQEHTILAIQDTTKVNLNSHPKMTGLGPIDAHGTQGGPRPLGLSGQCSGNAAGLTAPTGLGSRSPTERQKAQAQAGAHRGERKLPLEARA
jgi:hypothetical protein